MPDEARVGVYVCYCGGNISETVDCESVARALGAEPGVIVARTDMSLCSDAGQAMIEQDIREHGLNRVVVGACAPSLHETTFRAAIGRAGLNPYVYYHVCLREQDSWVHQGTPSKATEKAVRLMKAGVAKVRLLEPLEPIRLRAEKHALVIGGGVAGLTAALYMARSGIRVTLIEKTPFLGGRMAQLEALFPDGQQARPALHGLIADVLADPMITVLTGAELTAISGYVGDFQVEITQQSRGVSEGFGGLEAAAAACPVEVPDAFNYGLTTRKAIYRRYPDAAPQTPAIDWEHCTRCGDCLSAAPTGLELDNKPRTTELNVGALAVATGFQPYEPRQGEFGYGQHPGVLTLAQLIRLLAISEGAALRWQERPVRSIAFIHCVGSREIPGVHEPHGEGGVNDYCSRVCCTATLHAATEVHHRFPDVRIFDFFSDIRTYGRGHEEVYVRASEAGVCFLRFHNDDRPEVVVAPSGDESPLLVRARDHLTWGRELEVPVDLVVLATAVLPSSVQDIVEQLKIAVGTDHFLLEAHPKLRPVETAVSGVVLAGSAQAPMNIPEACAAASAAAAKVAALLGRGSVTLEPFVARVAPELCDGTGRCVEVCAYEDAIRLKSVVVDGVERRRAVVTPANCVGCGVCVSACPNHAIDVQGWTLAQYEGMVDAITADLPGTEVAAW
jgi:heterodisulfide reductase subunit A